MIFEYDDNLNSSENIDLISFDSTNSINQIMKEPFPIIPIVPMEISDKKRNESSKEISSFRNDSNDKKAKYSKKFIIKNSKGRKKEREKKDGDDNYGYVHDKLASDNILRKVQVHYLSFILKYANAVLIKFEYDEHFVKIDYKLKRTVNKKNISFIKRLTIGDILCWDISPKFNTREKDYNKKLYLEVIKKPIIKKIFQEQYLYLFRNIYHKNNRIISLVKYGSNESINLSKKKVMMFKEFLEKNEIKNDVNKNNEYLKKINDRVEKNFLSNES